MASGRGNASYNRDGDGPKRIKAIAYAYASDSEDSEEAVISSEIILGNLIDRFGVEAIYGRPYLGAGEIQRILAAQRIVGIYQEMERSADWAEWAVNNKSKALYLEGALQAAKDEGYLKDG